MKLAPLALCLSWMLAAGCARAPQPTPPSPPSRLAPDYVDLQPGWMVQVVIPILRSGGYVLPSLKAEGSGGNQTVEAGHDFLGYERDFYSVAREATGVRVYFRRGQVWKNGKMHSTLSPRLHFLVTDSRHVRLVFLTRLSNADHDMAIVSSNDPAALEAATREVTARGQCVDSADVQCTWVPNGVAVTPEPSRTHPR